MKWMGTPCDVSSALLGGPNQIFGPAQDAQDDKGAPLWN